MSNNSNLHKAKEAKNDEFYTRIEDIEKEMKHYKDHFKGKVVLCNCDDPEWSNFWKYFSLNFDFLGLKKLISTHYEKDRPSYKLEMTQKDKVIKSPLKQNGDFRSPECIEILKNADIVATNPPFSLFREYFDILVENKKHFIVIAPLRSAFYNNIFQYVKDSKVWLGHSTKSMIFNTPNNETKVFNNIRWLTNLKNTINNQIIPLYKKYDNNEYSKYDTYDAIEVSKIKDIPMDYCGKMGVPITFLDKYNPNQFEILSFFGSLKIKNLDSYCRLIIKHKEKK